MRLFVAIEIPISVKEHVLKVNNKIKLIKGVRVVKQENIHLTLLFLGDVKDVKGVAKKLSTIIFSPFDVVIVGAGFFPNQNNIKVVWLGIRKNKELVRLQKQIANLFEPKNKYIPHLTIARTGFISATDKQKLKEIMAVHRDSLKFRVSKFRLYNSELTPMGPVHRVLDSFESTE